MLSKGFTDKSAEALGKAFVGNNLFAAHHSILLRDGKTQVTSIDEWNKIVNKELEVIYTKPELSSAFTKLKKF